MSNTIVDMPKVAQMLDAGWELRMFKNQLGTYTAEAIRSAEKVKRRVVETDDFTPEQALTRLAYKVHGEII